MSKGWKLSLETKRNIEKTAQHHPLNGFLNRMPPRGLEPRFEP